MKLTGWVVVSAVNALFCTWAATQSDDRLASTVLLGIAAWAIWMAYTMWRES